MPDLKSDTDNKQTKSHETTITIIAPPSATELNDRRAVRCRSRRERPRKIRPLRLDGAHSIAGARAKFGEIDADTESFISSCLPGVGLSQNEVAPKSKLIRKRSLPLMSFLSTTTYAAAEKRRKNEELSRQRLLAEEAARKIMIDSTLQLPGNGVGMEGENLKMGDTASQSNNRRKDNHIPNKDDALNSQNGENVTEERTTVRIEGESNILMPPLLVEFLTSLKKHKP